MAQGAQVVRWGPAVRGREAQALEVFAESAAYFDDLVKNHRLSSHHPYICANRNGGMWVLNGDTLELSAIREEDDYIRLIARVQMVVEDYSAEICYGGTADDLSDVLTIFGETLQDFT